MAVLAKPSAMSGEENEKRESRHEFNHFSDRQVQSQLLQVDDDYDQEGYERRVSLQKSVTNMKGANRSQKSGVDDILGWFPDAKFVARRNDVSKNDAKPKDTFIHPWRDYRAKKDDVYVFKHYTDSRKYAEQYRNEHGCLNARYPSGGQLGEMRRLAFQAAAPPQQSPGHISVVQQQQHHSQQQQQQQQQHGSWSSGSPPSQSSSASLHYTNRKEHGNRGNSPNQSCSCNKQNNYSDPSSQSHRYKLSPGTFSRTNTEIRCPLDSDNSSESGGDTCSLNRTRTPQRRISSATSSKCRQPNGIGKSPTKICVPANPNPRAYPIQALTIAWRLHQRQQNGLKTEVIPSPRALDNLNCVAPEKQSPLTITRSATDTNLGLSLRVQSLQDLLVANEVPLRGYALPKSLPPQRAPENNENNEGDEKVSDSLSDKDDTSRDDEEDDEDEDESLGKVSNVPVKADRHRRVSSQALQAILNDPVLSKLNQRPQIRCDVHDKVGNRMSPKLISNGSFDVHVNNLEAIQRVNMWNPIVSTQSHLQKNDHRSQGYKKYMAQNPFRPIPNETRSPQVGQGSTDKYDCFSPSKTIRLSITRLDNAVSFCRTQVQQSPSSGRKSSFSSKGNHSAGTAGRQREEGQEGIRREQSYHGSMNNHNQNPVYGTLMRKSDQGLRMSSPALPPHVFDPFSNGNRQLKFDNKINLPLPQVKIFENVPVMIPNSSKHTSLPMMESAKTSLSTCKSAKSNNGNNTLPASRLSQNLTMESQDIDCNIAFNVNKDHVNDDKHARKNSQDSNQDVENGNTLEGVQGIRVDIVKKTMDNNNNGDEGVEENEMLENRRSNYHEQKTVQKPSVASGKFLRPDPELDGLTWTEKLEILRSVNKPTEKPKPKRTILKYIRDEPEELWETEQEQLYEQRRIRHLVEQARTKGGKQFDWVFEAQLRARGIEWNSDRRKRVDRSKCGGDGSGDSSDEDVVMETQKLGKYGIYVPPKKQQKVYVSQSVQKSRTFLDH